MDEDKHFLDMLDAATERVFEAYTRKMATGSCSVAVPQSEQVVQYSPSLQQGKELGSQLSFRVSTPPSDSSCFLNEPQNRRKRSRTCEEPSFQGLVPNQINIGLGDKNQLFNSNNHFVSWPQNFTFQCNGVNKSIGGFESKQSSFLVKNHCQLPKKSPSRIRRNLSSTGVFDPDRSNIVGSEKKEVEKSVDFSKEIEEAINRIESLIPSLQKLVNTVHSPKQDNVFDLGLPKFSSLAATGENMVGKQADQMLTTCNHPVPSRVKLSRNINRVVDDDDDVKLKQSKNADIGFSDVNARISQVPRPKVKAGMGSRSESLKGTPSRNGSFASHNPVHIQGSRIMPRESSCEGAIEKDITSRPCSRVPSLGSTNFMSHNRTRNVGTSHQKWSQSHKIMPRLKRNTVAIRNNVNETSQRKVASDDPTSEETACWGSCASSGATTQQSSSSFSSSGTYDSSGSEFYDSNESEPRHETAVTESSAAGYDDTTSSSYYDSRDEYSDGGHSSQMSSVPRHRWKLQKERGKRREGRLRRLRNKLGLIFHHHHHHHHHYSDKDEPDEHHGRSFWTRLGEMFHRTPKTDADNHHRKTEAEKPRKSEIKSVVKRKQQGGHFHALVDGLMKHMKRSKKPKQVKNGVKGLGNGRHRGKNLLWWPKIRGRRGGVKVSNKGKVKLGNYRTKSMAAAKMILGK